MLPLTHSYKVLLSCPRPCGARRPKLSVPPRHPVWVFFSGAERPLAGVLEGVGPRCWSSPEALGQVRLELGSCLGEPGSHGVSSGTCVCGTAPPAGPGTEVSRSAAGRGAPAGRWRSPAPGGPGSASGPGSLLELERSGPDSKGQTQLIFIKPPLLLL